MNITLDVNVRFPKSGTAPSSEITKLRTDLQSSIHELKEIIMATLLDIQAELPQTALAVDSLIAVVNAQSAILLGLQTQLDAAIAANDPVAFDAIKAELDAIQARAAEIVAANTPAEQPAEPV